MDEKSHFRYEGHVPGGPGSGDSPRTRSANEWREFWRERGERELRLLLQAAWNPIDSAVPADEYDRYATRVATLLASSAPTEALAAELGRIRTNELGLAPQPDDDARAAAKISAWFAAA